MRTEMIKIKFNKTKTKQNKKQKKTTIYQKKCNSTKKSGRRFGQPP
jgi:hypothetical protein